MTIPAIVAALALALLAGRAAAQDITGQPSGPARGEATNDARPGLSYREARARLSEAGWSPARFTDPGRCGGRTAVCEACPEAGACSGTGRAPCLFVFFDQGACAASAAIEAAYSTSPTIS